MLTGRVLAAYVVVSLVWGSTYLAIRIGVQHLPPALFGGLRFLTAGLVLLGAALALGGRLPARARDWRASAVVGIMLLSVGNGAVIWAEQFVESGTAAVFIVTGALWMTLFDALIPGSEARPTWEQVAALLVGLGGVVLLVGGNPAVLGSGGWVGPRRSSAPQPRGRWARSTRSGIRWRPARTSMRLSRCSSEAPCSP